MSLAPPRADVGGRLLGGCVVGFVGTWNVANIGALAQPLAHHYGTTLAAIGLFTTANFLGEVGAMVPGGALIDRIGAKRVALISMAVCLVGNAALLFVDDAVLAIGVRGLIGLGVGASFLAGSAYARSAGQSTLLQGIYGGASLSAGGVALAVVPQLEGAFGWQAPYVSALALAAVGIAIVAFCPSTARHETAEPRPSLLRLALDRKLAHLGMLSAAGFGISVIVGNWAPTLLSRTQGYDKGTAGVVAGLTILLGIVGRPAGGAVARHWPAATRSLIVGAFLAGAGATALLAVGGPLALLLLCAAVIGVAAGTPFGPIMSGATRAHPEAPGVAIGAMSAHPAVAVVVGTPLIGLTFALPGDGRIGFFVLAGLWALAALATPAASELR